MKYKYYKMKFSINEGDDSWTHVLVFKGNKQVSEVNVSNANYWYRNNWEKYHLKVYLLTKVNSNDPILKQINLKLGKLHNLA